MDPFEKKLGEYIKQQQVDDEHLVFKESCHSVEEAAKASNSSAEDFHPRASKGKRRPGSSSS